MMGAGIMRSAALAGLLSVCAIVSTPASAGDRGSMKDTVGEPTYPLVMVSGLDATRNLFESYSGAYFAFNRDLDREGVILRLMGTMGRYDYRSLGTSYENDYWQGDAMLGYQWVRGGVDVAVYVGIDHQNNDVDDIFNPIRGSETGFKVAFDIATNGFSTSPWYFSLGGAYSTAFDTYHGHVRVGHKFGRLTIGPEAWILGDASGDAQRIGAFVAFDLKLMPGTDSNLAFSAGHQFGDRDTFGGGWNFDDGFYATVQLRTAISGLF